MKLLGYLLMLSMTQGLAWKPVQAEAQNMAQTRMTKAQAIQAARAYCQRIGVAVTAPAKINYPYVDTVPEMPMSWQPRWQVVFQNQVDVEIVDATGLVCNLRNYGVMDAIPAKAPAGEAIPKAEAIEKARVVMRACGYADELAAPDAFEQQISPPTMQLHRWLVMFPRVYGGIPYKDQGANVLLQAETGEPVGFTVKFTSPIPDPAPVRVAQADAVFSASSLMSLSLAAGAALDTVKTEIVQPNTFWQPNGSEEQNVGKVRTAHVVTYKSGTDRVEVWLDAETGDVLGGSYTGLLSANSGPSGMMAVAKPPITVHEALKEAREVLVYRKNKDDGGWHFAPALVLNRRTQTNTFEALRAAKPEAAVGLVSGPTEDKVVAVGKDGTRSEYVSIGGYMGDQRQWVRLPTGIQSLISKTQ